MEGLIHTTQAFNCSKKWLGQQEAKANKQALWERHIKQLFSSEVTYNIKNPSNGPISTTGQDSEIRNTSKEI